MALAQPVYNNFLQWQHVGNLTPLILSMAMHSAREKSEVVYFWKFVAAMLSFKRAGLKLWGIRGVTIICRFAPLQQFPELIRDSPMATSDTD